MGSPLQFRLMIVLVISLPSFAQICDFTGVNANGDPISNGVPIQIQVQLAFTSEAGSLSGGVVSEMDNARRGDSAGSERSRDFADTMIIRVELQEPLGGTLQESAPTRDGKVRFVACSTKRYRLRVTGSEVEEAVVDSVYPAQERLITVVVHRKPIKPEGKTREATISAHRLRVPRKAQKEMDRGNSALKRGKLQDAKIHFAKAVAIYPRFDEAENNLGIVLMREGNKAEGKAAFTRAVSINQRFAGAYVNLAKVAFDEKQFNEAYSFAKHALTSEPLNPGALFLAAESAFFAGRYSETVSYSHTLHSLPHDSYALVHFLAAKSLQMQDHPDVAIVEYQTFLDEDPVDANANRARQLLTLLKLTTPVPSQLPAPH